MALLRSPDGTLTVFTADIESFPGWEMLDAGAQAPEPCPYLDCGPAHKHRMHQLKWAEALLVRSGVRLTEGLLFHESRVTGEPIESLAAKVIAHNLGPVAFETNRRAAVVAARGGALSATDPAKKD